MIIGGLVVSLLVQIMQTDKFVDDNLEEIPEEVDQFAREEESDTEQAEVSKEPQNIFIDVKGQVNQPGVYQVEEGKRVRDLIQMAGGFTEEANQQFVNLAQKVVDEMIIFVPKIGEEVGEQTIARPTSEKDGLVDINYATKEEITSLSGIGSVKATAIINYREENGLFQSKQDLLQVNGIGQKTLETIEEAITVR